MAFLPLVAGPAVTRGTFQALGGGNRPSAPVPTLSTGPLKTQLTAQLLRQFQQPIPNQISSVGEGFARLGSRLVDAYVNKKLIDKQAAQQQQQQTAQSQLLAQALAGNNQAISNLTAANPQLGLSLMGQQLQQRRLDAEISAAKGRGSNAFNIPVSQQELASLGFDPGTVAFKNKAGEVKVTQKPQRDSSLVTVDVGGKKGEEALAKGAADQITAIRQKSQDARRSLIDASQIQNRLDELTGGTLEPGSLAGVKKELLSFLEGAGIETGKLDDIARAEDFNALSNQLTLAATGQLKGTISDRDIEFVDATVTGLGKTQLGNRFILKRFRDSAITDIIRNDLVDEIRAGGSKQPLDVQLSGVSRKINQLPTISRVLKDSSGLPIFFTEFYEQAKEEYPQASVDDIAKLFRDAEDLRRGK